MLASANRSRTASRAALLVSVLVTPAMVSQAPIRPSSSHGSPLQDSPGRAEEVELETADGITVYGDLYRSEGSRGAPLILLFHQGGANARGEYGPLIPKLLGEGYSLLAIDQRQGGSRLGGENRTVAALGDREFTYCEAYPDLVAALAYARAIEPAVRPILWGSSYSAALVIRLAASHPEDVSGVLAFSPASGDAMEGCRPEPHGAELRVPLLVLRPADEARIPAVAAQLETFRGQGHRTHVADPGVHGSSMLVGERVGGDVDETWAIVLGFLAGINR
jgi:pimeloyl-ACP methyl ester carboxylesterase